ncbi:MAG TPA: hypothetical protein PK760_04515 [Flavobacteriales bacterium]|nr:hypothetical protein [Flavobacteriales bacterium]
MTRSIKLVLLAIVAILAIALAYSMLTKASPKVDAPMTMDDATAALEAKGPFKGLGLRYDGYYRCDRDNMRYLARFFPEGRVVTINGTKEVEGDLPKYLLRETQGNPGMGLYNTMCEVRNDSLFFTTHPMKGEISYRGRVMSTSTIMMHRHSHINGVNYDMEYLFHSDAEVLPASNTVVGPDKMELPVQ